MKITFLLIHCYFAFTFVALSQTTQKESVVEGKELLFSVQYAQGFSEDFSHPAGVALTFEMPVFKRFSAFVGIAANARKRTNYFFEETKVLLNLNQLNFKYHFGQKHQFALGAGLSHLYLPIEMARKYEMSFTKPYFDGRMYPYYKQHQLGWNIAADYRYFFGRKYFFCLAFNRHFFVFDRYSSTIGNLKIGAGMKI